MKSRYLAAAIMLVLTPASAQAADTVRAEIVRADGYVRVNFVWPEADAEAPLAAEASIDNQVLVVRFSREVDIDVAPILAGLSAEAALARLDPDQRTLRVALSVAARPHVSRSYNILAVDLVAPELADPADVISPRAAAEMEAARRLEEARLAAANAPPPPPAPLEPLEVRRATSPAFDRIVFDWPERTDYAFEEQDGVWVLSFASDAEPDLASLRTDPPARLSSIEARHRGGRLQVHIAPAPGSEARAFRERNTVIVDLAASDGGDALLDQLQALAEEAAQAPEQETATAEPPPGEPQSQAGAPEQPAGEALRPDPTPASGVVTANVTELAGDLLIEFPFAAPVKAAAFRRADAVWIVFDAAAALDVSAIGRVHRLTADAQAVQGENYSAVRITTPETVQISLQGAGEAGARWTFALAEQAQTPPASIRIERRDGDDGRQQIFAVLPGAGEPVRLAVPGVGDTLLVVPAPAPARGVLERRDYLGFFILPSAQGLAVESLAGAMSARTAPEGVWIDPALAMASNGAVAFARPLTGPSPALIAFVSDESGAQFEAARSDLETRAARDDLPATHMEMAKFLLARELAPEALGALELALERDARLSADPTFRALRGVAYALSGRLREAENDLSTPALEADPTAQVWRAWLRAEMGDWAPARRAFAAGEDAIGAFPTQWRARFRESYAHAALQLNDLNTAKQQIDLAGAEAADAPTALRISLGSARWREAAGQAEDALAAYEELAQSKDEEIAARAILAHARLAHEIGRIGPNELIETLEGLRWRWRGDETELETIQALGAVYVAEGRNREGLEAMKAAVARFPDHPVSRSIFTDMMSIFNELFLAGGADRLDPVEAVALYHQFSDLTPAGSEGDRMIRRLSERLVAFDLLPQAAELLQHQVDQRLHEPRARAEVAANLALIYLMDRQPEAALRTLRGTRVTQLPPALAQERKIIEARALAELEAYDSALDLIAGDPSMEAARLRADIAWTQRDWMLAGERLEEMLGDRWSREGPLSAGDSVAALRAAIAYSLARDRESLVRLIEHYGASMRQTQHASAFTAVTQELETSGLRLAEIAERAGDVTAIESFLAERRERLESHEEPTAAAVSVAPAPVTAIEPQAGATGASEEAVASAEGGAG
jgi:hypothetical protein